MTLGDIIKHYRTSHSMSMAEFAKASGLSKAYIGILEKNVNPTTGKPVVPSIVTFKAASLAMGMDMNELLELVSDDSEVSLEPVDNLDFELSSQEIFDDSNTKLRYSQKMLAELAEPLSVLPQETIDKLLEQFKELIELYRKALE